MGSEQSSARKQRIRSRDEESADVFDVPATVVCARCAQPDCMGCEPAGENESGVVTLVPWERPGSMWTRLWSTASAATQGAETFFATLPDGELSPALRFALVAETLAIVSMVSVLAGCVLLAMPTLLIALIRDAGLRAAVFRFTAVGLPLLTLWMIMAHTTHGAILDLGARSQGGRPQRRRALRFGLYACGWDLMSGPLGAVVMLISRGRKSMAELLSLSMSAPGTASMAFLQGVYGIAPEPAKRARKWGTAAAVGLSLLSGAVVVGIIVLAL